MHLLVLFTRNQIHSLVFNEAQDNFNSPSKYLITKDGVCNIGLSATLGAGLRQHACWDCGFESRRGDVSLSVVSVVCCQVEISATS